MAIKNPFNKKASESEPEPEPELEPLPEPAEPKSDAPALTDEGVPYTTVDTATIRNDSTDLFDSRRRELHLHGVTYCHVSEGADGAWIYRHDK